MSCMKNYNDLVIDLLLAKERIKGICILQRKEIEAFAEKIIKKV